MYFYIVNLSVCPGDKIFMLHCKKFTNKIIKLYFYLSLHSLLVCFVIRTVFFSFWGGSDDDRGRGSFFFCFYDRPDKIGATNDIL